ncbi:unnamed protein product [Eruca vesicaria subsp. sativa]|uniref:Transmembrane protein n=1 Tax=Eruca vesicaria subsp. sativa TaxID=29727 RepID=A0ABC8JCD5_ERUVS|nr:unnamed protein product [Eruca vesicaria subsp. sativa]
MVESQLGYAAFLPFVWCFSGCGYWCLRFSAGRREQVPLLRSLVCSGGVGFFFDLVSIIIALAPLTPASGSLSLVLEAVRFAASMISARFLLGSAESCALLGLSVCVFVAVGSFPSLNRGSRVSLPTCYFIGGCAWNLVTEALRYVYRPPLLLFQASWTTKASVRRRVGCF